MRVLTEAVLFAFIHERIDYYGINDFNSTRLRKIALEVLKSESRNNSSSHSFDALYSKFQDRRNFGQAFKVPPSKDEVRAVGKWISELENASFARQ
jgi:hypothetical protein